MSSRGPRQLPQQDQTTTGAEATHWERRLLLPPPLWAEAERPLWTTLVPSVHQWGAASSPGPGMNPNAGRAPNEAAPRATGTKH